MTASNDHGIVVVTTTFQKSACVYRSGSSPYKRKFGAEVKRISVEVLGHLPVVLVLVKNIEF